MNTTVLRMLVLFLAIAVSASMAIGAEKKPPAAEDFLAPLEGGTTKVEHPERVSLDHGIVAASTAQDAINAAVVKNKQNLAGDDEQDSTGIHTRLVRFPSGIGVVATGIGTYENTGDVVLSRISQRHAYVVAFTEAKQNLATFLKGLSHEGQDFIRQHTASISSSTGHLNNVSGNSDLTVKQATEHLLRAFVAYEVADDPKAKRVFVSIVSTPKTCGQLSRSSATAIDASSMREGLAQLLAEIRSGMVFPLGCRIITVPATGETAVVGFGSQVVQSDLQPAVSARLRLDSQKIAAALARDSLCGMIIGDKLSWEGRYSNRVRQDFAAFEDTAKDNTLVPTDLEKIKRLEKRRELVVAEARAIDSYRSVRQGQLPPGVMVKTWFDDDGAWAYGVAVYLPSATRAAMGIARQMQEAQWITPVGTETSDHDLPPGVPAAQSIGKTEGSEPTTPLKQGPTGRVNAKDL